MSTVFDSLRALSAYPIPDGVIIEAAEGNEIDAQDEMTAELRASAQYKMAQARVYYFLADAPNISQGGVSYSFSAEDKKAFRTKAVNLEGDASGSNAGSYGWQGEDF